MNDKQKILIRTLLSLSYSNGFNMFSLAQVSAKSGLPIECLYNEDTESGELWAFHPAADGELAGLLDFSGHGENVGVAVVMDTKEMLEHWSDWSKHRY